MWENVTGGGGGDVTLREPLSSINNTSLGTPTESGQVLTWNGSQWIYAIPQGSGGGGTGTVTSITAGTGLSGGTINTMGTIAISSEYQGYISHGETAYGWGNHSDAGYALQSDVYSKADADNKFLSVAFFNRLFRAYNGTTLVTANDTTSTIDNIEAMFGFWTNQYISALGRNSSGGGGGGSYTLAGLDDVQLSNLANGQALVYDSTSSKWVNGTIIPDLTDYATKSWVQQQSYITASTLTGYATETWVESKGYAIASNVYSKTDADAKFLTVAFFDRLFKAYNGTT